MMDKRVTEHAFEWDPKKATANRRKHGVTFEEATSSALRDVFSAARAPDHSNDEERHPAVK